MPPKTKRREQIRKSVKNYGVDCTAEKFGITRETVRRYMRKWSEVGDIVDDKTVVSNSPIMQKIQSRYTEKELELLANGGIPLEYKHRPVHKFSGKRFRIGYMTDLHIGSLYTDYSYIDDARKVFAKQKVDMVAVAGDITEGMSHRPGHIYECSELGYDAQKERAIELFTPFNFCPVYMIDGNHDRWYVKSNGALIVKAICRELKHAKFLGHDEGDILIDGSVVKLWHGEDSSSYAISYRLQKLIESLSGGDKPNIIIAGHVHKYGRFFIRNVHCISAGCIQKQSKWMRGKRIDAHTGFGILELVVNERGVGVVTDSFYPFYS